MFTFATCHAVGAAFLAAGISLAVPSSASARAAEPERDRPAAATAPAPVKPLAERIAGTWRLVSFYDEDETGEEIERWGTEPKGRLSFDDKGRFAFQLEDDVGFHLCAAYGGTYRITTNAMIRFHPDAWAAPGADEADHFAEVALKDNTLDLTSSIRSSLTGSSYSHTRWQRLPEPPDTRVTHCGR